MGLKEIYLKGEDKWYGILDRIDAHLPIYKVVDKIDGVVPSFALFIALVALLVLLFAAIGLTAGGLVSLTITIEDTEGNLLEGVSFDYAIGSTVNSAVSNEFGQAVVLVPAGSSVEISVAKTTLGERIFEPARQAVLVEKSPAGARIVLEEESPAFVEKTLVFQNAAGERMSGRAIKVMLSCQNPLVTPSPLEASDLDFDGVIIVREPRDCGVFQATVIEPAEFKQKSYVISQQGTQTLMLEEKDVAKGIVRVRIKDSSGKLVLSSNFDVKLLDSDGIKAGEKYSQNYGEAIFTDVTAGTYSATIEDVSGDYGMASASGIEVSANETAGIDIVASKSVKVTLTVKVLDKGSGARISGATLRVVDAEGKTIAEKATVSGQDTIFSLTEQGGSRLSAMHSDYLYETVGLGSAATQAIEVKMERITASNSGRVEVEVVDEDNLPVKNAKVKLRFLDTGMLVPVEPKITDRNGFAAFSGVKPGSYYAYVEKFPASGDNKGEGKEIDIRAVTKFKVRLLIGNSLVQVKAFDEDSQPVREAEAEFFSLSGESLGKIPLTDGTGQFGLKADKQVFAVISHPDFMAVQAMPVQLWPGKPVQFNALMEPKLILGLPKVEFGGIYDSAGMRVQEMKAGNKYVARFKLSVPEEGDFAKGGFHFRIGDEALLVNDQLVVKDAIAGRIIAPLKGTTYTPPLGYEQDSEGITEGDAKWINISWPSLKPMNYYFGFEVRVKSQVMPYTRLPMHYRAWAIGDSDYYARVPADAELGNAESVSGKQALYAKTLDIAFLEGQPAECLDDFCYSGESMLDQDEGLYIQEPYEMRAGAPHLYTFSILNNSERQYSNSQLYITVDGIAIEGYKIRNASAQEIARAGISTNAVEGIDLGAFTKGKSISGEVNLKPSTPGPGLIEAKIIADGRVVFLREIYATILSGKAMAISLEPSHAISYVETALLVSVDDVEFNSGIENALVKVLVKKPDKTELFYSGNTNGFGKAMFNLPALEPSTKIIVRAEKPDYYAEPVEIAVDSNVLRFDPAKAKAAMETRGAGEKLFSEKIENSSALGVEIGNVSLSGRFNGMLDRQTMENYSRQFIGTKISANDSQIMDFFKAKLSQNIGAIARGNEKIQGEYWITALNRATGIQWDIVVPLEIEIKISGLPDNSPCIVVTRQEWPGSTQGNRATIEFEVLNNCMTAGKAVGLDDLQAKLSWNSDIMGSVELSLTDSGSGQTNTETLKPEMWAKIISGARPESTFYGMLTFTPLAGFLGKDARFSVAIDGAVKTGPGTNSLVGAVPEKISADLRIINLEQCIQYPGAEDILEMAGETTSFTVDATECGDTTIDIELCQNDTECRGGSTEGGVTVTPKKFTLSKDRPAQDVLVARQSIAGMYGIPVSAKTPGRSYRKVALIDLLVKPDAKETFTLDKYAFTLVGAGSKDNATLTNKDLAEQVTVDASACDWGTAEEKGMFNLAGAGVGAAIGALLGMKPAMESASKASQAINFARTTDLVNAEKSVQAANSLVNTASSAGDAAKIASEKAKQQAIATAAADTKATLAAAKTIPEPIGTAIQTTAAGANTKMAKVETAANGTFWTKVGGAISGTGRAIANIAGSVVNVAIAKDTASPNSSAAVSSSPYDSQKDLDKAINNTGAAAADMAETGTEWGKSLTEAQTMAAELKAIASELAIAQGQIAAAQGACVCPCGAPSCCSCTAQVTNTSIAIEDAVISVDNAISATEAAAAKITDAQGAANNAATGLNNANQALVKANASMGRLGNAMSATQTAASFSKGRFLGILGTYAALGAVAGGLIGGIMGVDPCSQRVQATLMDYIINLKDDAQPVAVENTLIAGWWNTEDAKVFGTYEKQEVGVYFENQGLAESDAIYSVAKFPATRHFHNNPTMIPKGNGNFAPFNVPDQATEDFAQKYHLKFVTAPSTSKVELLPQETHSCLQGSLFGETGEEALPDVKFDWSWGANGISMDSCDYGNENGIYCDSTQFGIALTKKMQAFREFLAVNQGMACPTNPAITGLEETTAEFNAELAELGFDPLQLYYPGCWVPLSTTLWDGKPAMLLFVEQAIGDGTVHWTNDVQNIGDLERLVRFRARLIKDGYSPDFQKDFADFYSTKSFYDSPNYFDSEGAGKWADYFKDTGSLRFKQRFAESSSLPDAGIYDVLVNIGFDSGNFEFFGSSGGPDAKAVVEFLFLGQAYPNSVFYYLPFNGNVGRDSSNGRMGYGLDYSNTGEPIAITTSPEMTTTKEIYGSSPVAEARIDVVTNFKAINSIASKRGFLLELEGSDLAILKNISFYPNYATPVVMKISKEKTNENFSAFYEIKEAQTPVEVGTTLSFWTGTGPCLDFSGAPVYEAFRFSPDRSANQLDPVSDWQFAYATDWDKASYGGNVFLKAVFYSPMGGIFKLKAIQPGNLVFMTPDSFEAQAVDLQGIAGMQHNSSAAQDVVSEIREIFDLVKAGNVCVTDTGSKTSFWWNPKALNEATGSKTSISAFEKGLVAGKTCIGYGN